MNKQLLISRVFTNVERVKTKERRKERVSKTQTKTQKSDEGKSILVDGGQPFVPCSTNTEDKLNQGKGSFNI